MMNCVQDIQEYLEKSDINAYCLTSDFFIVDLKDLAAGKLAAVPFLHDIFEISISKIYRGQVNIGAERYTNLDSTIGFYSPSQMFSCENASGDQLGRVEVEGVAIMFRSSFLTRYDKDYLVQNSFPFFRVYTPSVYELSSSDIDELVHVIDHMKDEVKIRDTSSLEMVRSMFSILMHRIKRILRADVHEVKMHRFQEIACQFEEMVSMNIVKEKDVCSYAKRLFVSKVYLSECVRKATGKSPKQIIMDYLILQSKSLLVQTSFPINEVAYKMGFVEVTNFTKFFKKQVGITPREFRKLTEEE
ncbi:helix-turn-helix transcriptional regulator [Halosquirtibacter xylanolyticus]|uniref:helix-turn-helix domain-containing protein n=1 Tax=Halosquirtibacter xylanolyticus TaxID=3374599 RepID=UPI00374A1BC5|nr:helix-turn-helix transcriptional regulator [Prolixibacteraceae bacterium]